MAHGHVPVAIVGAGPYGLSLAAHLSARGLTPAVFGPPMETWRRGTPPSMRLKSEGFASSLSDPQSLFTLEAFCRAQGLPYADVDLPTPVGVFAAYGEAFQQRFAPQLDTRRVRALRRDRRRFELELEDGARLTADACVVATGLSHFETLPAPLRALDPARVAHTAGLHDYTRFARGRTLVVGAGAPATNAALELKRLGADVTLTCRDESLRFYDGPSARTWRDALRAPLSPIGPGWRKWGVSRFPDAFRALPERLRVTVVDGTLGPAPAWFVRDEIEGGVPVLAGRRIVAARDRGEGVELDMLDEGGERSAHRFDFVVAGTGYGIDIDRLGFLESALRAGVARVGGAPRLSGSFETSIEGLYFAGPTAAYQFGPLLRFVCGADFAARRVARALGAASRGRTTRVVRPRVKTADFNTPAQGLSK